MFNGLRILVSVVAALLVACASKDPLKDWERHPSTVFQFCVTNPSSTDTYLIETVDVYADGEPASLGSSTASPVGFTQSGQLVFQGYGSIPPRVLRAVLTRENKPYQNVFYPERPSRDQWTAWKAPDFASNDYELSFKVQKQRSQPNVEKRPVSPDAPKARFTQKTYIEHTRDLDAFRNGQVVRDLPPC